MPPGHHPGVSTTEDDRPDDGDDDLLEEQEQKATARTRASASRRSSPRASSRAAAGSTLDPVPLAVLFSFITLGFAAIALWSAEASRWPIAAAAAALAAWMGTLAWAALRKMRS